MNIIKSILLMGVFSFSNLVSAKVICVDITNANAPIKYVLIVKSFSNKGSGFDFLPVTKYNHKGIQIFNFTDTTLSNPDEDGTFKYVQLKNSRVRIGFKTLLENKIGIKGLCDFQFLNKDVGKNFVLINDSNRKVYLTVKRLN